MGLVRAHRGFADASAGHGSFSLMAAGFAVAGVALMFRQSWWQVLAAAAAVASTLLLVIAWDGRPRGAREQGLYGIVTNAGIVACALVLHWPTVAG